jgi:Cytochrome c
MRKAAIVTILLVSFFVLVAADKKEHDLIYVPPSAQRTGDTAKGLHYLIYGDFLKSGFPLPLYLRKGKSANNYLARTGSSALVEHGYNVVMNKDSIEIVIPTCLQCHAQVLDGQLIIGLGNSLSDFTTTKQQAKSLSMVKMLQLSAPKQYNAVKALANAIQTVNPEMEAEVRGVNVADRLAAVLVAHRDPTTLAWSDEPLMDIPTQVIPSDVPAWWLLKKKHAMFYNAFGRGDFSKFLMASNLLTVTDTAEAAEVNSHFGDVLAYILSIEAPNYPLSVNPALVNKGKNIFNATCSGCHGTYGAGGSYPNFVVPLRIIRTDSMLIKANQQNPQFVNWFNKSWFAQPPYAAHLEPTEGYIAPPLDGVWCTAPYLHNGSVPTIEAVLNSAIRPTYWQRDFDNPHYDFQNLGWVYEVKSAPQGKPVYNTTLPGYGNTGHYFGDKLTDAERKAVIEYLKIL